MNPIIGFGIVLKINDDTLKQLEHVMDLVDSYKESIIVTHPKEGDYNDWKTEVADEDIYATLNQLAYKTSYADCVFNVGDNKIEARLSILNEHEEMLVKFDIEPEGLIGSGSLEELERATGLISYVMEMFDRNLEYQYMFCDSEADYIYSTEKLMESLHQPYALFKMKDRITVQAPWYLDGMTLRNEEN